MQEEYPATWRYLVDILSTKNIDTDSVKYIENSFTVDEKIECIITSDLSWLYKIEKLGYELDLLMTRAIRTIASLENPDGKLTQGLAFKKKESFELKKSALLTWASGDGFCSDERFNIFLKTAGRFAHFDKYIFTHEMSLEHREKCVKYGFKIIDIDPGEVEWIVRDRFLHWARFLSDHQYHSVGLVDCKDVVVFEDIFNLIELLRALKPEKELVLIGEGKKHFECSWNMKDQENLQKSLGGFKSDYANWEVICAGTIFGLSEAVSDLIMSIWSLTLPGLHYSDQAALNFLYQIKYQHDSKTILSLPTEYNFVATDLTTKAALKYFDKELINLDQNYIYALWHQWDRTIYKDRVLKDFT